MLPKRLRMRTGSQFSLALTLATLGTIAAAQPGPLGSAAAIAATPADLALAHITTQVAANRTQFFVYKDADSGFNHGFPSGKFGVISKIHIDAACVPDVASPTGCATNPARMHTVRNTVLRVTIDPLGAGQWAGINIEEPENYAVSPRGLGYDLRGATSVALLARTPKPAGASIQFSVCGRPTPYYALTPAWAAISINLAAMGCTPAMRANAHLLFGIQTGSAPAGVTVLLDDIRFLPVPVAHDTPAEAQSLPLANLTYGVVHTAAPPFPLDQVNANVTTTYESAIALLALINRGTPADLVNARAIADALFYALYHDLHGYALPAPACFSGNTLTGKCGLRNGYASGDLALHNGRGAGQSGDIRLPGFGCAVSPTGYCLVDFAPQTTGGNNAFGMLAFLAAYRQFGSVSYLTAARAVGNWVEANLKDQSGTGFGGYFFGFDGTASPVLIRSKSTENNADIYTAFRHLAAVERALGNTAGAAVWESRAAVAGAFVAAMYQSSGKRFNAGTVPVGTPAGPGITPGGASQGNDVINTFDFLDSDSFALLAMAKDPAYQGIDWAGVFAYMLSHFSQRVTVGTAAYCGFNIVTNPSSGPRGVAWEFTGQVVVAGKVLGLPEGVSCAGEPVHSYLTEIRKAQATAPFTQGQGLVAATLQNGAALPPYAQCLATPFQCIGERVGLAATAWAVFAETGQNVLAPPP